MQKARKLSHGCNICTEISQAFVKCKVWNSVYKDSIDNISDTLVQLPKLKEKCVLENFYTH